MYVLNKITVSIMLIFYKIGINSGYRVLWLCLIMLESLINTKRARRDLNPRPTEPESVALSTEPRALIFF